MLYQITISKAGTVQNIVFVAAQDALTAINQVEAAYDKKRLQLPGNNGVALTVTWTGFEFEARCVPEADQGIYINIRTGQERLIAAKIDVVEGRA